MEGRGVMELGKLIDEFTGEENEKEFLEKCIQVWEEATDNVSDIMSQLIMLGSVFVQIRYRLEGIDNKEVE